jgi:hypothetical protein
VEKVVILRAVSSSSTMGDNLIEQPIRGPIDDAMPGIMQYQVLRRNMSQLGLR